MTGNEKRRLWSEFQTGGFLAQKKSDGILPEEKCWKTEVLYLSQMGIN